LRNIGICAPEEGHMAFEDYAEYWFDDSYTGAMLNLKLVKEARREDFGEIRCRGIYVKVPIEQCWQATRNRWAPNSQIPLKEMISISFFDPVLTCC